MPLITTALVMASGTAGGQNAQAVAGHRPRRQAHGQRRHHHLARQGTKTAELAARSLAESWCGLVREGKVWHGLGRFGWWRDYAPGPRPGKLVSDIRPIANERATPRGGSFASYKNARLSTQVPTRAVISANSYIRRM